MYLELQISFKKLVYLCITYLHTAPTTTLYIEMLFSKVKSSLRAMELEMSNTPDIETIILAAFATVTVEDCISWIKSCDLYRD